MSSNHAIEVCHLSKRYTINNEAERPSTIAETILERLRHPTRRRRREPFQALDDVSFVVERGDILGIIGANGAGKSTLLKVLSRITAPTKGEVHLYGRVGSLLEVGTGFHPELTGRENIYLNGNILGMRRHEIDRRFDDIVEFAGISRFLETPVKRYSSGMYVRLAFAVAAHLESDILLIDEVLAVGDITFQRKCIGKVEAVAAEGRTIIFVSHSMETIARLCPNALLLVRGRVAATGSSREVIHRYVKELAGNAGARSWVGKEAPGDEDVRLWSIAVLDENGHRPPEFDITRPLRVEVEFEVMRPQPHQPTVSLIFKNAEGATLFASNSHHAVSLHAADSGRRVASCELPGNLLAEGRHLVTVMLNTASVSHLYEPDAVSFDIVDAARGDSVRGDYVGDWAGYVRPMLDWTIASAVGHNEPSNRRVHP